MDAQITYALTMHRQHVSTDSSNTRERHEVSIPLPEIYSVRSERERYSSSSIRKSRIDRRWKRLVKFLERCSEMLCGNWYTPSRRAVRNCETRCFTVKLLVQKLSPRSKRIRMISPSLSRTHTRICVSRENTIYSPRLYDSQQSHAACMRKGAEGLIPKVSVHFERTFRAHESP